MNRASLNDVLRRRVPTTLGCSMWLAVAMIAHADRRPNIVLIMADDLGYETVGCYGGSSYRTPHLDRLASEGVKFDRAYAMPLCTNTRIQLMTGMYNNRNWKAFGILDPAATTFGHLMQQAGYRTCIAGKWQLTSYDPPDYPGAAARRNTGMHPRDAGFDQYSLWHVGHTEHKGSRYADPVIEQDGKPLAGTEGLYGPDIWTRFIGDFMERHRDQPFFVYYSMALPHNPMVPTPDSPEWQDPKRRHQDETHLATDMIEYTDKMVGTIVAKLEELELRDETLVLFFSDNGTNWRVTSKLGNRMVRGGKGKATELGIRVPCIASWPGSIKTGHVSHELVDSVDFLPTLLDAAGSRQLIPDPIDGVSFLPAIKDGNSAARRWVYIHQDPRPGWDKDRFSLTRVALNKDFKLYEDGRLYDFASDPFEQTPLFVGADDQTRRTGRQALQKVLDSMKPYPMFDPATVPRRNPNDSFARYQFQDQGGFVVIEAERLPITRDESWIPERNVPGYLGSGYLRALRDQPTSPMLGVTRIAASIDVAGSWSVAIRCRTDHANGDAENRFWLKSDDGAWQIGQVPSGSPGQWRWVDALVTTAAGAPQAATFHFHERGNNLWIAPYSANLKIDRIVLYQPDRKRIAYELQTPMSEYHPWASP